MPIDDKIQKAVDQLKPEGDVILRDLLKGVIAQIPYIGGAITSLLSGFATREWIERIKEVMEEVGRRLNKIERSKLDLTFFDTGEFQTLFFLLVEQLRTTHDREKIKMVASMLVNSGLVEYKSDARKENFVRILRELSVLDLMALRKLFEVAHLPERLIYRKIEVCEPRDETLAAMRHLVSLGVAEEFTKRRPLEHRLSGTDSYALEARLAELETALCNEDFSKQCFRVTDFGLDFVRFSTDLIREEGSQTGSSK